MAGFCYFLPNGQLAYEWVYFFEIMPERYLRSAPEEVFNAYLDERDFVPYSMKSLVKDEIARKETKEADHLAQDFIAGLTPVSSEADLEIAEVTVPVQQHSSRKRKFEHSSESGSKLIDELIDPRLRPAISKRPRLARATKQVTHVAPSTATAIASRGQAVHHVSKLPAHVLPTSRSALQPTAADTRRPEQRGPTPRRSMAQTQATSAQHAHPART
jgi:hypothetical protein